MLIDFVALGLAPGPAAAAANDAIVAAQFARTFPAGVRPDCYFAGDPAGGSYYFNTPLCPQWTGGATFRGDGRGATMLSLVSLKNDPIFMLGFIDHYNGVALSADHFVSAAGRLDGSCGQRYGFATKNDAQVVAFSSPLAVGLPGPPYRFWADIDEFTLEYCQDTTGIGNPASPSCGISGTWYLSPSATTWSFVFYTQDAASSPVATNILRFTGPADGVQRATIYLKISTRQAAAWVNGTQVTATVTWTAPTPPNGSTTHLVANLGRPFTLGGAVDQSIVHGNEALGGGVSYDRLILGCRAVGGAVYALDGVGQPQRRLDSATINDQSRYFAGGNATIGFFPFQDAPSTNRLVPVQGGGLFANGSSRGYAISTSQMTNFATMSNYEIRDMTLATATYCGDAVAVGNLLNSSLRRLDITAGARGIACWNWAANYPIVVEDVGVVGGFDSAIYTYYGKWRVARVVAATPGRNVFVGRLSDVYIDDSSVLDNGSSETIFKSIYGSMRATRPAVDLEGGTAPTRAIMEAVLGPGTGGGIQFASLLDMSNGAYPAGVPLLLLNDDSPSVSPAGCATLAGSDSYGGSAARAVVQVNGANWTGTVAAPADPPAGVTLISQGYTGTLRVVRVAPFATPSSGGGGGSGSGGLVGGQGVNISYPAWTTVDDSGAIVTGATVTIASIKLADGTPLGTGLATLVSADPDYTVVYDAETNGEAYIVLGVSKVGATITGTNAAPRLFATRDSGRILSSLDALVSSRLAASADSPGTATLLGRLTPQRAANLDNLDASVAAITAQFPSLGLVGTVDAGTATPTATAFAAAINAPRSLQKRTLVFTTGILDSYFAAVASDTGPGSSPRLLTFGTYQAGPDGFPVAPTGGDKFYVIR